MPEGPVYKQLDRVDVELDKLYWDVRENCVQCAELRVGLLKDHLDSIVLLMKEED